jgi:beta-phosphoglucomutase-like phosphatase (HAD superfamily)
LTIITVVGVADRSDRGERVVVVEDLLEGLSGVLRAGIAVVGQLDVSALLGGV